jgi:hypothetical protein
MYVLWSIEDPPISYEYNTNFKHGHVDEPSLYCISLFILSQSVYYVCIIVQRISSTVN